jgi:hypothetical protein
VYCEPKSPLSRGSSELREAKDERRRVTEVRHSGGLGREEALLAQLLDFYPNVDPAIN